jgi:hypothetical protein
MKLHTHNVQASMADRHDNLTHAGSDFKLVAQACRRQRVIASNGHRVRTPCKDPAFVMVDQRRFSVDDRLGTPNSSAENFHQDLMTQAHPEDRNPAADGFDELLGSR